MAHGSRVGGECGDARSLRLRGQTRGTFGARGRSNRRSSPGGSEIRPPPNDHGEARSLTSPVLPATEPGGAGESRPRTLPMPARLVAPDVTGFPSGRSNLRPGSFLGGLRVVEVLDQGDLVAAFVVPELVD